jgi:flavin-dependent dehydrogenase
MPRIADLCVVGAGPAGLAVAIASAARGLRVRLVDAAREAPIDKACGEGLLPGAFACLRRLGVHGLRGHPLTGIRFLAEDRAAEAHFPGPPGLGVRRTELHRAMLHRAAALGVFVEWATPVHRLPESAFTVAADGSQSRIRAAAGLGEGRVTTRRIGLRQHFAVAPWSTSVEVHWTGGAQAYITPVAEDQVGVAFLSTKKLGSIAEALELFPALRARLAGAPVRSTPRGALTVTRRLPRVTAGDVALVGDASGSVDAITGEGLNLCFRQAEALADALAAGNLPAYEQAHIRTLRMARIMSSALLLMGRNAPTRIAAMAVLARAPSIFEALLRLHIGLDASHTETSGVLAPLRSE